MPMKPRTYSMTDNHIRFLNEQHRETGLACVEILRRALDFYIEYRDDFRFRLDFLTKRQKKNIRIMADMLGVSDMEIISQAVNEKTKAMRQQQQRKKIERKHYAHK